MQRRQLKSKEDFPSFIYIFVDDWHQNTNSFVLWKKKQFYNCHLDPNKGSKGDPKGIQRGSKGDPKGIQKGSKGDPKGIQRESKTESKRIEA